MRRAILTPCGARPARPRHSQEELRTQRRQTRRAALHGLRRPGRVVASECFWSLSRVPRLCASGASRAYVQALPLGKRGWPNRRRLGSRSTGQRACVERHNSAGGCCGLSAERQRRSERAASQTLSARDSAVLRAVKGSPDAARRRQQRPASQGTPSAATSPFITSSGPNVLLIGGTTAVVLVAVQTASHLVNALLLDGRFSAMDAGDEGTPFSWLSSLTIFTAGLAAFALARALPARRSRLVFLGAILMFFSLDDVAAIHERIAWQGTELPALSQPFRHLVWPVVYLPILGAAFVLIEDVARQGPRAIRPALRLGLGLLAIALAAEAAGTAVELRRGTDSPLYAVEVAIEEGGELAGWLLIATGLTMNLVTLLGRPVANALPFLRGPGEALPPAGLLARFEVAVRSRRASTRRDSASLH